MNSEPLGSGVLTIDHVLPSQRAARVPSPKPRSPTAKQLVALVHEMAESFVSTLPSVGAATIDQLLPFQCSINPVRGEPPVEEFPTAKQSVVLVHATPGSSLKSAPWFGLATIDQIVPFHRTMNVFQWTRSLVDTPTAKQSDALAHATDSKRVTDAPAGHGLATLAQLVPFHCSISGLMSELVLVQSPTAKQLVAPAHATATSLLLYPGTCGAATVDHTAPSHVWINGRSSPNGLPKRPTATQSVALVHATLCRSVRGGPPGLGLAITDHAAAAVAGGAAPTSATTHKNTTTPTRPPTERNHRPNELRRLILSPTNRSPLANLRCRQSHVDNDTIRSRVNQPHSLTSGKRVRRAS